MSLRIRNIRRGERADVEALLERGGAADTWMAHCLLDRGVRDFLGAFEDGVLTGLVVVRAGAIAAAACTTDRSANALGRAIATRVEWRSVIGPQQPCACIVRWLALATEPRVDRAQILMAVHDAADLAPAHPSIRPATMADRPALGPIVAQYRYEDGLATPGEENARWVDGYVRRRIEKGVLYVVEDQGEIVWTGAFNFLGSAGAGLGGIFTVPSHRGCGISTAATAALCHLALEESPRVTLHVAETNTPARRCYVRAGLTEAGRYRLTFR